MSVSAGSLIVGLAWLILSMGAGGGGVLLEEAPDSGPIIKEPVGEAPIADPVEPLPVRGWLNLKQVQGTIDPFLYGQSLETLGRGVEGGLLAELLQDRKFFEPPSSSRSPWARLGSEIGWSLTFDVERPYAGAGSVKVSVTDRAQDEVHGIAQHNLPLLMDREYEGHLILAGRGIVKAILQWGDRVGDRDVITIRLDQQNFGRYPLRFRPRTTTDAGVFSVGLESTGAIWIAGVSLMPADHLNGVRADTVALLEGLNTALYRWPGGRSLIGYDWRDGIGPRDRRPPRQRPSWREVESNDFGIEEFLALCRQLGAVPLVVVDTGLGSPELAAALVQYCNGSERTTWGRRRALNGQVEPYGVQWWGVGGALPGAGQAKPMPTDQRLARHREFARAMRAMDQGIKLVGIGQAESWSELMLARCSDTMDLLSERIPIPAAADIETHEAAFPEALRAVISHHRAAIKSLPSLRDRPIPIALDGWHAGSIPKPDETSDVRRIWQHGLETAGALHEITRHPGLLRMAHYAPRRVQTVGTIHASPTNAVLAPAGLPLTLYRHQFGIHALRVEGETSPLDVVAALTSDQARVTIGIVNPSNASVIFSLDLVGGSLAAHATRHRVAFSDSMAFNQPGHSHAMGIEETVMDDFDPAQIEIPPVSMVLYVVPLRR